MAGYVPQTDPSLINRNQTDILNRGGMLPGEGTDSDVMDFLREILTNPDVRPPVDMQETPLNPDDYIRQQLAGDVVNMQPVGSPLSRQMLERRMQTPGFYQGSQGQQSIDAAGGKQSPMLDLMDILQFNRRPK